MPLFDWLPESWRPWPSPALPGMRLAPESNADNPLMVSPSPRARRGGAHADSVLELQAFTWDAQHKGKSWWAHLEEETGRLRELGFSQLWLPPAHKAMRPVRLFLARDAGERD
jgi:alpha-amylase